MKLLKYSLLCIAPLAPLSAATFLDFEGPGYVSNTPLTDSGWSATESAPSNQPLAWVSTWNGTNAGAIGGWYGSPVAGTYAATVATPLALAGARISFDMTIVDSTNEYFSRDTFGFSVSDGDGGTLATITFTPAFQSSAPESDPAAEWLVSYSVAGASTVVTGIPLVEGTGYSMELFFGAGGFEFTFGSDSATYGFSTGTVGYDVDEQSIGSVSFNWTKYGVEAGDNYLLFDNLSVIPEPSVALLSGLASLCLFRRRREK